MDDDIKALLIILLINASTSLFLFNIHMVRNY